jgi:GT2 family glycosyltransferase
MNTCCFICPTYGHYDYSRAAVESFLRHTPGGLALVIDDGHPEFRKFWEDDWNVVAHHFNDQGGLTRSWNFGLARARELNAEFAICGNNDILFTPGWQVGPTVLLQNEAVGLVGPLSNGPGLSNKEQNIWDHVPGYQRMDSPAALTEVAAHLSTRYQPSDYRVVPQVNGFFMFGRVSRWWEGRYDDGHVFDPAPRFALTGNEEELQKRFNRRGWQSVVSLRTFIFHYRSVTRGDRFCHGMWYRRGTA